MMSSPIVLLSSFNDEQRRKLTSLIEKLGGRVLQSVGYDQRCTHIVVGAILSTEKLLAGAIAGKWVVSPEYIECSYKARKWLEAERFILQTVGSGNVKKLSQVPTRWRSFRQHNGNQGPFRSWRVLLALPVADKTRYKRLLQAGGAHVISDKPPYVWSLKTSDKLTFVFTNKELFITVMSLYKKGVPCIHPDYVKDYIIQNHEPDVSSYRANVYCHPVKKQTTCGYRKITSYIFTTPKSSQLTTRALSKSSQPTTRGLSVRDKNIAHLPIRTRKVYKIKKERSDGRCVSGGVKPLIVSIPLGKVILKRSHDPVVDLTPDTALSSGDCVMSQPPSDCVMSQPPSDCVMPQPPSDCIMSQPPTDCVVSQPPSDCVMSQPSSDSVMSQTPSDCVMSPLPSDCVSLLVPLDGTSTQSSSDYVILESPTSPFMSPPPTDCVMSQPPAGCVMSQPPSDCVMSQPSSDCVMSQTSSDCVMSQLSSDFVVTQTPLDCVMSQPSSDFAMSQTPSDCVMSQPSCDSVVSQAPSDCVMSQPSSDCVTLLAPSDSTSTQSTSDCVILESPTSPFMSQPPTDCVMSQTPPTDGAVPKPLSNSVSSSQDCVTSLLPPDHTVDTPPSDLDCQPPTKSDMSQPPTNCVKSQPPIDCTVLQPPTESVMSQPPTDCVMSQPPTDCGMSQPPTESVVSQPPADCVVSQPPTEPVVSQPPTNCVISQPPTESEVSQPPADCVVSQPLTDDDAFQPQCASGKMDHASHDEVSATRLRFSSEGNHIKRCGRKRKRKCVSVAEFSIQQVNQCDHVMIEEVKELESTGVSKLIGQLPVITMILHQRGLWSTRVMIQRCGLHWRKCQKLQHNDDKVMVRTTMDTLLEGYLGHQQSLSRGVKYCHSLLTSQHVPSATILYQLASWLMSNQLEDKLVAMVSVTLTKLLLLHPPHGDVARQQYHKLFDLMIGDTKSGYRKWEGLFLGITNRRPQLLQYLTDVVILDYHRWLSHGDQPLLHKIVWNTRPCDTVTRPMKELTQQFIQLLDNYHVDKYPYLESLCYLMFLTGHYLQSHSATPTQPAAPPPHLRAVQLACSERARRSMKDIVKCYDNISDYCKYNS